MNNTTLLRVIKCTNFYKRSTAHLNFLFSFLDLPVKEKKDSINSSNNHPASQLDERNNNFTENEVTTEEMTNSAPISKKNNSTTRSFSKTCCLV